MLTSSFSRFQRTELHDSLSPFSTQTEVTNLDSYWDYVHCTKEVNLSDAELPGRHDNQKNRRPLALHVLGKWMVDL